MEFVAGRTVRTDAKPNGDGNPWAGDTDANSHWNTWSVDTDADSNRRHTNTNAGCLRLNGSPRHRSAEWNNR
jgi:hypothetical protein